MCNQDLEERIDLLENQISLLIQLVDSDKHPFSYHMLEAKATRQQVDATFALMDDARQRIRNGNPMNNHDFEKEVYLIFPSKNGSYGFAEGIVSTLNESGQFTEVFNYYAKNGMNLIP